MGGGFPPSSFKHFYITQKLANLVRRNFLIFFKIYLPTFILKNLKIFASASIFKKLETGNIINYISLKSIFFTDFKKVIKTLIITWYEGIVFQEITSLIWLFERSQMYLRFWRTLLTYILIPKCMQVWFLLFFWTESYRGGEPIMSPSPSPLPFPLVLQSLWKP